MKILDFLERIHYISISFFKVVFAIILGYPIYFIGLIFPKIWGGKIYNIYTGGYKDTPQLNMSNWNNYTNLKHPYKILSNTNNIKILTFFPFICFFIWLICKYQMVDIIKSIIKLF